MPMTVTLPDFPAQSEELEDYVAAMFLASGFFVEKNIIEREPEANVLELDAVATSYEESPPRLTLVEAKSGDWGFSDLFKVLGWMQYLHVNHGAVFVTKEIPNKSPEYIDRKLRPFGLQLVQLGDCAAARDRFAASGFPLIKDEIWIEYWRFSFWIERVLIRNLKRATNSNPLLKGPRAVLHYHHLVNNSIFFSGDIRDRLHALYQAFQEHPRLALSVAREIDGSPFEPAEEVRGTTSQALKRALIDGSHPALQACLYVEHRARIAVLKAAIDAVENGLFQSRSEAGCHAVLKEITLPGSFLSALDDLRKMPNFRRYALFWQTFLWAMGGFILADRRDQEYRWLAEQTGVPVVEIPSALGAFDLLFPLPEGKRWIRTHAGASYEFVVMVPKAFQGLGAALRRQHYRVPGFAALGDADYTARNLATWNNKVVELLSAS